MEPGLLRAVTVTYLPSVNPPVLEAVSVNLLHVQLLTRELCHGR